MEQCDPCCHCCGEDIESGDIFKLAEVDGNDEMLCVKCDVPMLKAHRIQEEKEEARRNQRHHETRRERNLASGGSGYTRKHQGVIEE